MKSGDLRGKKIIFICPKFIGYDDAIKNEIKNLGAEVLMFNDRPYNGIYDFFKKINIKIIQAYQNLIWHLRLRKTDLTSYTTLFMIRGEHVPVFVLEKCKKAGLEMIMYQWDSVKNYDYLYQKYFFEKVSTFDSGDAKLYGFNYFPLFYRKEYGDIKAKKSTIKSALFVGTYQDKRYKSVIELKNRLNKVDIETIVKIKIPFYYYIKLKLKGVALEKKYLVFKNITFAEMIYLYSDADIIIDVANEKQIGLTMRTFESLGANRVLVTNNLSILKEPFYNSTNIKLFDQDFSGETFSGSTEINLVKDQRIDNWIMKLLCKY